MNNTTPNESITWLLGLLLQLASPHPPPHAAGRVFGSFCRVCEFAQATDCPPAAASDAGESFSEFNSKFLIPWTSRSAVVLRAINAIWDVLAEGRAGGGRRSDWHTGRGSLVGYWIRTRSVKLYRLGLKCQYNLTGETFGVRWLLWQCTMNNFLYCSVLLALFQSYRPSPTPPRWIQFDWHCLLHLLLGVG